MTTLAKALPEISTPGAITETSSLDFSHVVAHLTKAPLRQYSGSLTTPPCVEGVTFLIANSPMPVTIQAFNAFKRVIKFNSRYTQNTLGAGNLLGKGE
jgi:carbonic anhydrase